MIGRNLFNWLLACVFIAEGASDIAVDKFGWGVCTLVIAVLFVGLSLLVAEKRGEE